MEATFFDVINAIDEVNVSLARLKEAIKSLNENTSIGTLGVTPRKSKDFKEQFIEVLKRNNFNKTKCAKVYGVQRRTIYRWIKEYGIN